MCSLFLAYVVERFFISPLSSYFSIRLITPLTSNKIKTMGAVKRKVKRKYRLKNLLGALGEPRLKLWINPVEMPQPMKSEMKRTVKVMVNVPVNVSKKLNKSIFKTLISSTLVNDNKTIKAPIIFAIVTNVTAFLRLIFAFSIKRLTGGS